MKGLKIVIILLITLSTSSCATKIEQKVAPKDQAYEVAAEGAWCWFADPRAIHYQNETGTINKTYIGYIDIHGNIKATQHDFISGETNEVLVRSYFQPDDHDNPTFLVLPDERVMVFYSRHTDEACFYYRVSQKPGDITTLGPELKIETKFNTTYPSPFILSDDPDHFYLCWRGISWHPTIAKITLPDAEGKVEIAWGPKQMVQSTASRPYAKYASNGKDKIYMAYTTGHPDPTMPNYLYFNYIDIHTLELKDIEGKVLSKIGDEMFHVATTDDYKTQYEKTVVDASGLRDWLWQVELDKDENPVIAMVYINVDKSQHSYYAVKWNNTEWQQTFLSEAGGHFHQSPNIEKCYSAGMAIDDQNTNEFYCSVPVKGTHGEVYEIVKYTLDEQGKVSATDTLTHDSELNNVRPYIIPNREESPLKLTWMKGNYYDWIVSRDRPLGYNTAIYADYELYNQEVNLEDGLVSKATTEGQTSFDLPEGETFSIVMDVTLNTESKQGVLVNIGNASYGLDALKPYIQSGEETFTSTNILGNSDTWTTKPRSTNGVWYAPKKFEQVQFTFIYANEELEIYINGLLDQKVSVNLSDAKTVNTDALVLQVNTCSIYKRALNINEIKTLTIQNNNE